MAKLANAPVYYTIAQVRHNALLKLEEYVSTIQEAVRKAGYPDYRRAKLVSLVWAGSPSDENVQLPQHEQVARHSFSSEDRTRGFVLLPNSISFETTRYGTWREFLAEAMRGFRLVADTVGGLSYVDRIGLRYLDAVVPTANESVHDYVNREFHGLSARLHDAGAAYEHSFTESRLRVENVGVVVARVLFQHSRLAVPPDIQLELTLEEKFTRIEGENALLDTDGSWEKRESFDLAAIEARFTSIHDLMSKVFECIASPHALKTWA